MGPIGVRRALQRHRRHLVAFVAMFVCAAAIVVHHSGAAPGDAHGGMQMGAAVEMCLAAFTAVGAAVLAVVLGLISLGRWRPTRSLLPAAASWLAPSPMPRARAGPALILLLCVSRR
jgi:hypothetical protein